jgi:uncharacterized protein YukE
MKIDYETLNDVCTSMHNISKRMKEMITTAQEENKTLPKDWYGEAANFYGDKFDDLVANFDEAYKELLYAILFMVKKSDSYQTFEQGIIKDICADLNIAEPNLAGSTIFSE